MATSSAKALQVSQQMTTALDVVEPVHFNLLTKPPIVLTLLAGNIIHPTESGKAGKPSEEVVPESATRVPGESYQNFHTGRGGEGNVHKDKYGGHSSAKEQAAADGHKEGLMEKVKHAIGMDHKKEKTPEAK